MSSAPRVWKLDDVSAAARGNAYLVLRRGGDPLDSDQLWLDWPLCVAIVHHVKEQHERTPISELAAQVIASVSAGPVVRVAPEPWDWRRDVLDLCASALGGAVLGAALTVLVFRALGWAP